MPDTTILEPPTILEQAIALLQAQTDKGIGKYGQPLDAAGLSLSALLAHKSEEIADELQYTLAAKAAALDLESRLAVAEAENERLASENTRLRSVLLPLSQMAQELLVPKAEPMATASLTTTIAHVSPEGLTGELIEETIADVDETPKTTDETPKIVEPTPKTTEETPLPSAPPNGYLTKAEAASRLRISSNDFKALIAGGQIAPSGEYEYRTGLISQYFSADALDEYRQARNQQLADAKAAREAAKEAAYNAGKAAGSPTQSPAPHPKIDIAPPQIALPDLISQGKWSHLKGFFVGYHRGDDRLEVFGMPREMGLPPGWVVAAVVEPMVGGEGWTCHIPTTVGVLKPIAEQIKDLVMGEKKGASL
jgi:hypothetical protein